MTKEELEKEAEEYVPNINWHAYSSKEIRAEMMYCYQKGAEPREEQIKELQEENAELQEENAELKEKNKVLRIHQTNAVLNGLEMKVLKDSHSDRANKAQDQLTKAKELLIRFVWASAYFNGKEADLVAEAKQFLKEV